MSTEPNKIPTAARVAFQQIIQDFKHYLYQQKKDGISRLDVSAEALKQMGTWGKSLANKTSVQRQGPLTARIFLVDSDGHFFNGDSGALLEKILKAMTLSPDQVCIFAMGPVEAFEKHVLDNSPQAVITLGEAAARLILHSSLPLDQLRGRFYTFANTKVMPTYSPSLLIKDPSFKRQVWEDMKQVMKLAGLAPASQETSGSKQ